MFHFFFSTWFGGVLAGFWLAGFILTAARYRIFFFKEKPFVQSIGDWLAAIAWPVPTLKRWLLQLIDWWQQRKAAAIVIILVMLLGSCAPKGDSKIYGTETVDGVEMVWIKTTVSQGYHYAFQCGYAWQLAIGVLMTMGAIYLLYRKAGYQEKSEGYSASLFSWLLPFALLVAGFFFMHGKPYLIAGEKYRVSRQAYEIHGGDTNPLIDSLFLTNHLRSAPAPKP